MNLKFNLWFFTMLLGVLVSTLVMAQTSQPQYFAPTPFPRSPSATAIEKYGTYQVNQFTGVPDISIPLFTAQSGSLSVPIALSYHASGVKVTDVASWVGLGWSLATGGQITRRAIGLPDDGSNGYLSGYMKQPNTYSTNNENDLQYLEYASNGTYDTKPDIYSYDVSGHSGKFFFDGSVNGNFTPQLIPFAPIKVTRNTGVPITQFKITDEKGNNYQFNTVETTSSGCCGRPSVSNASAWKISSMISQDRKDTISFSYASQTVVYPSADSEIFTVVDQIANQTNAGSIYTPSYQSTPTTLGNSAIIGEQLPTQIIFKNGKITFDLDPSARQDINLGSGGKIYGLADLKVYSYNYNQKAYELQKTVVFYKSYFNPNNGSKRLKLDSIQVLDKLGSVIQKYSFDYNQSLTMPDYSSYQQDYWGYYNGKANNMLTPQQNITYAPYNGTGGSSSVTIGSTVANGRNCDSTYMQACILTGIHYPTGGYSTFVYQTNQYSESGTLYLAGGLRIKTISSYDGLNVNPIVHSYQYKTARKNYLLDYAYFSTQQTHRDYEAGAFAGAPALMATAMFRSYVSSPHCDLEAYDGATVVYPSVTEYFGSPTSNIGKTDYLFTDQSDANLDASQSGSLIYLSAFYLRGHLVSKNDYLQKADGTYQLVKSENHTYTAFPNTIYKNVGLAVRKNFFNEGKMGTNPQFNDGYGDDTQSGTFTYPYYYIQSDDNYLTSTTIANYDQADATKYTSSSITYKYDNITHQQVNRTYHTDSKGNTTVSVSKYPADYLSGNSTGHAVLDTMLAHNIQAEVIEKWDTVKNATYNTNGITSAQLNLYRAGNYSGSVVADQIKTLNVATPITNFTPAYVNSGSMKADSRYLQMISFDKYDQNNNLVQYKPRNSLPVSIIWDYQNSLPIAQIKNGNNTTVAYTSFEANGTGNWSFGGTPVSSSTTPSGTKAYQLSSGSISAAIDATRAYVFNCWSNGGQPSVTAGSTTVTGTALKTVNGWTYYEYRIAAGKSSLTISGSTLVDELRLYPADAQLNSLTYDPNGVTSTTDAKGTATYYEYDMFQRLVNIKDYKGNTIKHICYNYAGQKTDCTIPQVVYARLEFSNSSTSTTNTGTSTTPTSRTTTTADLYVRFYADAACTQSTTVPASMNVVISDVYKYTDPTGAVTTTTTQSNSTAATGVSQVSLGNKTLSYSSSSTNKYGATTTTSYTNTFNLISGSGYTVEASTTTGLPDA